MALNLNKGGEENSKPSNEKKGLNLSKSGDTQKNGLNLGNEDTIAKELNSAISEVNEFSPKKKNPVIFILLTVVVLGVGIFWFLNKDATSPEQTSTNNSDNVVSISSAQTEPIASSEKTPSNQEQEKSVNSSSAASADNSASSSPESNVSASSNNVTKSNNAEISNSTPSKNQSATSTSAPSAITPVGSIDEKVIQVIRGNFGIGFERKTALGDEYAIIQAKVNEWYRNNIN